ncbi:MAG: type II toxin-antitoxin system VapC family toxin [Parvibaculaceae bacterium]
MPFLLDTNVISAARRPESQDPAFQGFLRDFGMSDAFLSSVTIMEIRFGIQNEQSRNPAFAVALERWLKEIVLIGFADRIIPFDLAIALRAGALTTPNRRPSIDAMIAATAIELKLHVATRNVAHFEPLGVTCLNPWRYASA